MKKFYPYLLIAVAFFTGSTAFAQSNINGSGDFRLTATADTAIFPVNITNASYVSLSTYGVGVMSIDAPKLSLESVDGSNVFAIGNNNAAGQAIISDVLLAAGTYRLVYTDNSQDGISNQHRLQAVITDKTTFEAGIPTNDTICNALTLDFDSVYTNQSNQYTTAQRIQGESNLSPALSNSNFSEENVANSIWYTFTGTSSDIHSIKFNNLSSSARMRTPIAIYQGNCSDFTNLTLINTYESFDEQEDSLLTFCIQEGVSYYVMIDGEGLDYSTFDIQLDTYDLPEFTLLISAGDTTSRRLNGANGVICPVDTIVYEISAELVNAIDSSSISSIYQAYINTLQLSVIGQDTVVGTAENTFTNIQAGTYNFVATDECGMTLSSSITFVDTIPDPVSITISDLKNADCVDAGSTGSVTVTVEGGIINQSGPAYTPYFLYQSDLMGDFTNSDNFNTATIGLPSGGLMNLQKGIYRLYYEDACGTYDSVQFVIDNPEFNQVNVDSIGGNNPICVGNNDGSLNVSATGGQIAGLDITWYYNASNDTSLLFSNVLVGEKESLLDTISSGLYAVVVSDLCSDSSASNRDTLLLTLTDPNFDSLVVSVSSTAPSLYNSADGSATINKTGGSTLDSVKWYFNGQFIPRFTNNLSIDTLSQGYYRAEYRDECLDTNVVFEFNLFAPLANDDVCDAISINVGDSINRFSNQGSTTQAGEDTISIPVDTENGWSAENQIQSSVWFSFIAPSSGSVNVTVKTAAYPFANRNFDPQVAIFGGECNNVSSLQLLSANDNSTNPAAAGNDNNSYQTVNCLTPGNVYYILVDGFSGLGQEGIFSVNITTNMVADVTLMSNLVTIDCNNTTASLTVDQPNGGIGNLITTFDGDTLQFILGQSAVTGIVPGTYDLVVYDDCGIADQKSIVVEGFENRPFTIEFDITAPTCEMGSDAEVEFLFGGGASINDYTFTLRNNLGIVIPGFNQVSTDSSFTATGLSAAEYAATLEDNCGNEKEFVFTVVDPVIVDLSTDIVTNQPACNGATGSIDVTINDGSSIFFYNLSSNRNNLDVPANMTRDTSGFTVENLAIGTYYLFVREFCVGNTVGADTASIDTINIVSPMLDPLSITTVRNNPSANGLSDGSFSFSISGGLAPYTFTVFRFNGNVKTDTLSVVDSTVTGLNAGTYRIEYSDSCTSGIIASTVTLLNPPLNNTPCGATLLTLGTTVTGNNQAASLSAVDANVTAPENNASCFVEGTWCSNDGITAPLWYKFVVPTSGNLVVELNSTVFDPQLAIYTTTDCSDGTSFQLLDASDDLTTTNDDSRLTISCLTPGDTLYALVDVNEVPVAGVRGAFSIRAANNNNAQLNVLSIITNATTNLTSNGRIDLDILGGAAPFTIVWADNASAPEDRTGLKTGTYTVTVTDACGVSVTKNIFVDFNERSNDRPCTAQSLLLNSTVSVSTVKANVSAGEPSPSTNGNCTSADVFSWCGNDGLTNTVWYTFTASQSGMVSLSTCANDSTAFDTQIAVYSATTCSDFTSFNLLAANDDNTDDDACNFGASKLLVSNLTPCATYYVQVDSKGPAGTANLTINSVGGTVPNAGASNSSIVCFYDNTFDLSTLLSADADANGVYVDSTNSNVLTGSNVDISLLDTTNGNTFVFYYVVGEQCNGAPILGDAATLTLIVDQCVGVTETAGAVLNVYPNPSNSVVYVNNATSKEIFILSNDGKVLMSQTSKESNTFDISKLASGVYTVVAGNERVRLLKQ